MEGAQFDQRGVPGLLAQLAARVNCATIYSMLNINNINTNHL